MGKNQNKNELSEDERLVEFYSSRIENPPEGTTPELMDLMAELRSMHMAEIGTAQMAEVIPIRPEPELQQPAA